MSIDIFVSFYFGNYVIIWKCCKKIDFGILFFSLSVFFVLIVFNFLLIKEFIWLMKKDVIFVILDRFFWIVLSFVMYVLIIFLYFVREKISCKRIYIS